MKRKPRAPQTMDLLDPQAAVEAVGNARLLCGMTPYAAEAIELALQLSVDWPPPGTRSTVLALAVEDEAGDCSTGYRLSLEGFNGQWKFRIKALRACGAEDWVELGTTLIGLEAARAIAAEILRVAPERPEGAAVQ